MSWLDGPMLGFDTETTGVSPTQDRIVTAALILRNEGKVVTRTWLIDPGVEIPARATEVHGITTEKARAEGVSPEEGLEEIAATIAESMRHQIPIVGFNVQYDLTILESELARHGLATLGQRVGDLRPVVDPLVLDRHLDRYRKGPRKLIDMCHIYVVPVVADDLHAADADVLATLDLVRAIADRYPAMAEVSLDSLHDQQAEAHRVWATHFAAWLKSKGTTDDLPSPHWPVATADDGDERAGGEAGLF